MGKKRRVLNNPKFAFLKKIRFLKSFADEEQAQEQVAVVKQKVEEKIRKAASQQPRSNIRLISGVLLIRN